MSHQTNKLGSLEAPVAKYLQLTQRKRELEAEYKRVNNQLKVLRKDPQLMTVVGLVNRLQEKRDKPADESSEESEEGPPDSKKRKAGDAKKRLSRKLKDGPPPVDKSLQSAAEK